MNDHDRKQINLNSCSLTYKSLDNKQLSVQGNVEPNLSPVELGDTQQSQMSRYQWEDELESVAFTYESEASDETSLQSSANIMNSTPCMYTNPKTENNNTKNNICQSSKRTDLIGETPVVSLLHPVSAGTHYESTNTLSPCTLHEPKKQQESVQVTDNGTVETPKVSRYQNVTNQAKCAASFAGKHLPYISNTQIKNIFRRVMNDSGNNEKK